MAATPPPLFDELVEDSADVLGSRLVPVTFAAGACLFKAGDAGDCCFVIDAGVVRIDVDRSTLGSGSEIDSEATLTHLEAGQLVGELALLDRLPRSASAYAQTDVLARRLDASELDKFEREHPLVAARVYAALGKAAALKLRETTARLALSLFPEEPDPEIDEMVARAEAAQSVLMRWSDARVDRVLEAMASLVVAHAEELARANVAETGLGRVESKVVKNVFSGLATYASLEGRRASGVIGVDALPGVTEIAGPVGVVLGLGPVTNPVSTFVFKTMICLKARNALILSPNRAARDVSLRVEELLRGVLSEHGAPVDLVQCVRSRTNRAKTLQFMAHPGVGLVLATGGASMVKAAYSSGTPAIGVGAGNTPTLVCGDADLVSTVEKIVLSKSFDNGLLCGAENSIVVVAAVADAFVREAERQGAAVLSADEVEAFSSCYVDRASKRLGIDIIGRPADGLAERAGIERPFSIRLIIVPSEGADRDNPYAHEKLAPVVTLFRVRDEDEGFATCRALLAVEGAGHTASIHSGDEATITRFGEAMPASRILVNSPASFGMMGMTTGLVPSATLGCGTYGGTSTTDNVTYTHVLNVKRLARYLPRVAQSWARAVTDGPRR